MAFSSFSVSLWHRSRSGRVLSLHAGAETQVQLVEALVAKHKDDVEAMARDIKINQYQHSVGQLRCGAGGLQSCSKEPHLADATHDMTLTQCAASQKAVG